MKMIQKKRPLWAALFFAGIMSSCELPEQTVGLNMQPDSDLLNLYQTDTLSINMRTVREDSVKTDEVSLSLLGNMVNPIFGQTGASIYTQIRLSTNNVDFGNIEPIIIDSLVLVLAMDKEFYGDLVPMRFSIKELDEQMYLDSGYYSSQKLNTTGANLIIPGHEEKWPNPLATSVADGEEVPAQLRFRLNHSLAQRFLDASGTTDLANNTNFVAFFKGFHISCNTTQAAILRFDLVNSNSRMLLYYRPAEGEEQKTFGFNINSETARYTAFEHGFTGSAMSSVGLPDGQPADVTGFVKTPGGSKIELDIPNLLQLNNYPERTINKAQIILPLSDLNIPRSLSPERLFVLRKATDGSFVGIADQALGLDHVDGTYYSASNDYRMNISRHVQQVLNGAIENTPLYIVSGNAAVTARATAVNGPAADSEDNTRNARLVITFSN